jgi:hypothetical protein
VALNFSMKKSIASAQLTGCSGAPFVRRISGAVPRCFALLATQPCSPFGPRWPKLRHNGGGTNVVLRRGDGGVRWMIRVCRRQLVSCEHGIEPHAVEVAYLHVMSEVF